MNTISTLAGNKSLRAVMGPLIAIIILCIVLSCVTDSFLRFANLMNIMRQTSINALVSTGMLLVLLTGGIDLSVGSTVAVSACTMGVLMKNFGVTNSFTLIVAALLVGLLIGLVNGLLFTKLELPHPFVSTLGMQMMLRGVALLITGASPITGFPKGVTFLGFSNIGGFPIAFITALCVMAVFGIFLKYTALGRYIYSVGGNKEAARLSGVDVENTLNFVYVASGILAALAAIVLVGRVGTAAPLAGDQYEMDAVAACVIGGASFSGGRGTVVGTLVGALLIAVLRNGLNLLGAQSATQRIVVGAVIIVAVFIDVTRTKTEQKMLRLAQSKA